MEFRKFDLPRRVQKDKLGLILPSNTIYVGPGSIWQNPFKIGEDGTLDECLEKYERHDFYIVHDQGRAYARIYLKGKDLACTCSLERKCHADILLKIANNL